MEQMIALKHEGYTITMGCRIRPKRYCASPSCICEFNTEELPHRPDDFVIVMCAREENV